MLLTVAARRLVAWQSCCAADEQPPFGLERAHAWTTSRLVGSPEPPLPYTVEKTFDEADLKSPIYLTDEPGSDYLWIHLPRRRAPSNPIKIVRFQNDPAVSDEPDAAEVPGRTGLCALLRPRIC